MIKMVYSTGDLLLPRVTRVPYPDPGFWWTLGCLETSPQSTGSLMGI